MPPVTKGKPKEISSGGGQWEGTACFSGDEIYFEDHFPGYPLVPGVLLFEAMRETARAVLERSGGKVRLLEATRLRLIRPCIPPIEIRVLVRMDPKDAFAARCEAAGKGGEKYASARLLFEEVCA